MSRDLLSLEYCWTSVRESLLLEVFSRNDIKVSTGMENTSSDLLNSSVIIFMELSDCFWM